MRYTYLSDEVDFFRLGYFDSAGNITGDVTGVTSTTVTLFNPATGVSTTFTGSGFFVDASETLFGTINSISTSRSGETLGTVTEIAWDVRALSNALDALELDGTAFGQLAALINQSASVIIDASMATGPIEDYASDAPFAYLDTLITSPMTLLDSPFDDRLIGGLGNDTVQFQTETPGLYTYNEYEATAGNDTLDFTNTGDQSYVWLDYDLDHVNETSTTGLIANINGAANTGTIAVDGFTDTLVNVATILGSDALGLEGTSYDDTVNYTNGDEAFMIIRGNEGNDTFNLTMNGEDGGVRLDYRRGNDSGPNTGITANLATGLISDGFGFTDTVNASGDNIRLEVRGSDLADTFIGSDRSDSFITREGNDTVDGGEGFDRIRYDRSNVERVNVDLETGTASVVYTNNTIWADNLTSIEWIRGSREGDDQIRGSEASEYFEGRGGNDLLAGRAGDDTLEGGEGNDTLEGGDGRDRLRGGDGDDVLDASTGDATTQGFGDVVTAGLGQDTILGNADHWAAGIGIDVGYDGLSGIGGLTISASGNGTGTAISGDGTSVSDTFTFADYFFASEDADVITGSSADHSEGFSGRGGNDTIDGGGGNGFNFMDYRFEGGTQGITVNLAAGTATDTFGDTDTLINIDRIYASDTGSVMDATGSIGRADFAGGAGEDTLIGGDDGDRLHGEGDDDLLTGNDGDDTLEGGEGNDTLIDGLGNDSINGGDGDDLWIMGSGEDTFDGGEGFDSVLIDLSAQTAQSFEIETNLVTGDSGAVGRTDLRDVLTSVEGFTLIGDFDITLTGNEASNIFVTDAGSDTILGAAGNDDIVSGAGNDDVSGGDGFDTISAGDGNDTVDGGNGRDFVFLNQGDDLYLDNGQGGELGQDTVFAGLGNDTVEGGNGDDVFYGEDGNDVINARLGNDLVFGGNGFDTISAGDGNDTVYGGNGRDLVFLNQGDDLYLDNGQGGELGRDTVYTGFGNDTVEGGNGDDVFYGEDGNDVINARLGNDLVFGGNGFDTISAGDGNDTVYGGNGRDLVFLNQGDDLYLDNGQGGELGRDTVYTGLGNDTVQGGNGDDVFFGEAGNDLLIARLGNDTLLGGAGADTLNGGDGADTFVFEAADAGTGVDVVQDFVLGTDVFELRGAVAGDVTANLSAGLNAVVVAVDGTTIALLEGADAVNFTVDDILFA